MLLDGLHRTVVITLLALALLFESTDVDLSNPEGLEVELFGFGFCSLTHPCRPGAEWGLYGTDVSNSDWLPIVELEDDDCPPARIHIYYKFIGDPLVNYLPNATPPTPLLRAVFHPPPSI